MKELFTVSSKNHGKGSVKAAWHPEGRFLATAGRNGVVNIVDRHGEKVDEIGLNSKNAILQLSWSPDGDTLAILQAITGSIAMWNVHTRSDSSLETGLADPTFIQWSDSGDQLAIGTYKGNLMLYNPATRKKVPILGKHPKKILCGDWNSKGLLALGSSDGTLTLSNPDGSTVSQLTLQYAPISIAFGHQKYSSNRSRSNNGGSSTQGDLILINVSKSLILLDVNKSDEPIELAFQTQYGNIIDACWFGEGLIVMAFSEGFLVAVSSHPDELGEEQFSGRFFKEQLLSMACSRTLNRMALCGRGGIKVINMGDYSEVVDDGIKLSDREENEASMMMYSPDSQILTIATNGGVIKNFLSRMPNVYDCFRTYVAHLSSLREIAVVDVTGREDPVHVEVSIEPSFIALGPYHVAVGMNNRVWFYRCDDGSESKLVNEQEYLGTVTSVKLNNKYASVLCEGKVSLHLIESTGGGNNVPKQFPEHADSSRNAIKSMALTHDFLIYGSSDGSIEYFYIKDWAMLNGSTYRHDEGIVSVFPNPQATRLVFIDSRRQGFFYNPVSSSVIPLPEISNTVKSVLWDIADPRTFVAVEEASFSMFLYSKSTVSGEQVCALGPVKIDDGGDVVITPQKTKIPTGNTALLLFQGSVTMKQASGALSEVVSCTHDALQVSRSTSAKEKESFRQYLGLLQFQEVWKLALKVDKRGYWLALASKAMENMNIEIATRVYRHLSDAGMVIALEQLESIEDKNLLAGKILLLFGDYARAQELLLMSSSPIQALQMRRDLLHWDQALKLAGTLAPEQVPELSASYAQQLEFMGDHGLALQMYEQACNSLNMMQGGGSIAKKESLNLTCMSGIARSTLRMGDIRRGTRLVHELKDNTQLCKECGSILESIKQYPDAASIYEAGKHYDKAVGIYIQIKDLDKASPLIKFVTAPKLHGQFARAKEATGEYEAAVKSFEIAQDMDSVVRIYLNNLKNPEKAFSIVRKSRTAEGALAAARHCIDAALYESACEFLLLANKSTESFDLAQQHNEMETFTKILGDEISTEQALKVAHYYEQNQNWSKAGEFYKICGNYHKALKLFLRCGEKEVDNAVEVVGKARNDMLTHTLIDFLMGETDGVPKDPNYIFRLYMALGNFSQAAKTAIIIARQEQDLGNYKVAHGVLYETYSKLQLNGVRVPQVLSQSLMLLHTYILVKKLVKQGDHPAAARMLVRVSNNISKFPAHVINILTSTVIECQRASLKKLAYEFALKLMSPENRASIESKFKRKIEAIVRRPSKEQDDEQTTPCPNCDSELPETELDCPNCKSNVAYCIVSGRHMVREDWSCCPSCSFPALYSRFTSYLESEKVCPMCEEDVEKSSVKRLSASEIKLNESSSEKQKNQSEEEPQVE